MKRGKLAPLFVIHCYRLAQKQNTMNSIDKVNEVCKAVLELTDEDFKAVDKMAQEQSDYIHPLKGGTQQKFNKLGNSNQKTIVALVDLHKVLVEGKP